MALNRQISANMANQSAKWWDPPAIHLSISFSSSSSSPLSFIFSLACHGCQQAFPSSFARPPARSFASSPSSFEPLPPHPMLSSSRFPLARPSGSSTAWSRQTLVVRCRKRGAQGICAVAHLGWPEGTGGGWWHESSGGGEGQGFLVAQRCSLGAPGDVGSTEEEAHW